MFERFLTYARARRALKVGQFEDVIRLLDRPEVRGERRSEQLREQALTGILQRAQRRNEQGSLRSALDDVEVLLSHAPEFDGAVSLKRELEGRCQADQERVTDAAQCLQRARELADAGELAAARGLCQEALALQARAAEHAAVVRHIEGLERIQDSGRQAVTQALKAGDLRGLRQHLAWLRAASGQDEEVAAIHQRVSEAIAADLTGRLAAASNPTPVLDQVQEDGLSLEGLLDEDSLHQEIQRLAHKSQARVREELAQGAFAEAAAAWQGLHEVLRSSSSMGGMAAGMPALADALERRESGDLEGALDRMRVAARELDCAPLDAEIGSLQAAEAELHEALNRARDLASGGRLLRAREELVAIREELVEVRRLAETAWAKINWGLKYNHHHQSRNFSPNCLCIGLGHSLGDMLFEQKTKYNY